MHLKFVHLARGVAIMFIVMSHAINFLQWAPGSKSREFIYVVTTDWSMVFFILAGMLFHHTNKNFAYGVYLWRKFKFVIVPFLLVGIPGLIYTLTRTDFSGQHPEIAQWPWVLKALFLVAFPGEQYNYPLWFIPVMAMFFLAAPAFVWLYEKPSRLWWALALSLPLALFYQRPTFEKYQHFTLVGYYLAPYLIGIMTSVYREKLMGWIDAHLAWLLAALVGLILLQYVMGQGGADRWQQLMQNRGPSLNLYFLQRVVVFFALLGMMKRVEHLQLNWLAYLAGISFPIFFLHMYILRPISRLMALPEGSAASFLAISAVTLVLTVALTAGLKFVLRGKSRYLLGT